MRSSTIGTGASAPANESLPIELVVLRERVGSLPAALREELEPVVEQAIEEAGYRGRVLSIARDALVRLRLDLELARFDLDATRREREHLRGLLADLQRPSLS
jgi:hypothetical protein